MTTTRLDLSRSQILAHRRRVGALDERLPASADSLRTAAWAGLTDSMPRAAIMSIHARVEDAEPDTWQDPSLVQLWGPRHSVHVVAADDHAIFSLGRLPEGGKALARAQDIAEQLRDLLDGKRMRYDEAGEALGMHPNRLRYAAPTGTVRLRWEGARRPVIWTVPPPDIDPADARLELARRHLHVMGPGTLEGFARWGGVGKRSARATFEALRESLVPVRTPIGEGWILANDEPSFRADPGPPAPARLLPSGDAYWLYWGDDRDLLVQDPDRRDQLWTPRVWPGALLVEGEIVGTWRRMKSKLTIQPWHELSDEQRDAVEAEAACLPLPESDTPVDVAWEA